ncbi:hypothetical protein GCM10010252_26000 [Streptomyces aureoverticillatus]|nr:hypothetical protein GCM10010252_26000 [Streptomyces aureoverticillatus]
MVRETDARLAGDFDTEDFVTAVVAEFAPGRVRLANCGHHAPLHLPAEGPPRLLVPSEPSPPLGLEPAPGLQEVALAPGDRLLFYTDGIIDARDPGGTHFDLSTLLPACRLPDLDEALDAVLALLVHHTHGASDDDVALILIEPEPALPRPRRAQPSAAPRHLPAPTSHRPDHGSGAALRLGQPGLAGGSS